MDAIVVFFCVFALTAFVIDILFRSFNDANKLSILREVADAKAKDKAKAKATAKAKDKLEMVFVCPASTKEGECAPYGQCEGCYRHICHHEQVEVVKDQEDEHIEYYWCSHCIGSKTREEEDATPSVKPEPNILGLTDVCTTHLRRPCVVCGSVGCECTLDDDAICDMCANTIDEMASSKYY